MRRYLLKSDEFKGLQSYQEWEIKEISFEDMQRIPNLPRRQDAIAVYASGDMNATKVLNGIESVFGMDVIAHEARPNLAKNEPELNIYHCVVQKLQEPRNGYEYIMYGPSESETLFGHWKDESVLDQYIRLTEERNEDAEQGGSPNPLPPTAPGDR